VLDPGHPRIESLSFICTGSSWTVCWRSLRKHHTRAMAVRRPMEWEHEWRIGVLAFRYFAG